MRKKGNIHFCYTEHLLVDVREKGVVSLNVFFQLAFIGKSFSLTGATLFIRIYTSVLVDLGDFGCTDFILRFIWLHFGNGVINMFFFYTSGNNLLKTSLLLN